MVSRNMAKTAYYSLIFTIIFFGIVYAQTAQLKNALESLCSSVHELVPIAAMLMILLAAVIYATGQMMGAETRARANVWATSCLTGAIIGILIATIAPAVLAIIAGPGYTIAC
ncbi:MAG: hypothetical protein NTV88_01850 [Candidatus Micrarchaeota archaeon]|nr:hypothetical protein [Candidatus Micrarchaeota archaeon]